MTNWSDLNLPYTGMAFWIGWHYYRPFALEFPRDYEQTCALAALAAPPNDDAAAFRFIQRLFIRTLREYGYGKTEEGAWLRREVVSARRPPPRHPCALCPAAGVHHDPKHGRLCRRHYQYVRHRRKVGRADPYEGLEALDRRPPARRLVRCAYCGGVKRELAKRLAERKRSFCHPACYYAWRRGKSIKEVTGA